MKKLIVATQRVDGAHPALAATVPKLAALASRVEELVVLCDAAQEGALPENVRVHTFGARSRLGRGARFERALALETMRGRAPLLAHMIPLYAILGAPLVRGGRLPLLLWYTHWNATTELRLATRLATDVLSAGAASFPFVTPKLRAVGHGIDVERFRLPRTEQAELRIVALGRMSPMKRYATLLRAFRGVVDAGVDARLTIRGPALTDEERRHRDEVDRTVRELGLGASVEVGGPISWASVPHALAEADVLVNLAEAADKIVYEAAASGALPVASAPAFASWLPPALRFPRDDAEALAAVLLGIAASAPEERRRQGEHLQGIVTREHSVSSWADAVCAIAQRA